MAADIGVHIRDVIRRSGPIPFDQFMELSLYGDGGFFTRGRGAGRAQRDFVTSPTTGSLFGVMVAAAIDREWERLGSPDPFMVIEVGAGDGRLARDVLRAQPQCVTALRYVLVERSPALRAEQSRYLQLTAPEIVFGPHTFDLEYDAAEVVAQSGPLVTPLQVLPANACDGVLIANELLDNLPFGIAEFPA